MFSAKKAEKDLLENLEKELMADIKTMFPSNAEDENWSELDFVRMEDIVPTENRIETSKFEEKNMEKLKVINQLYNELFDLGVYDE